MNSLLIYFLLAGLLQQVFASLSITTIAGSSGEIGGEMALLCFALLSSTT